MDNRFLWIALYIVIGIFFSSTVVYYEYLELIKLSKHRSIEYKEYTVKEFISNCVIILSIGTATWLIILAFYGIFILPYEYIHKTIFKRIKDL